MLADLRRESAAGAEGFYNYDVWENERVLEGSATVALTMAEQLGDRIRCSSPVGAIRISPHRCEVMLTTGEVLTAANVVCAVPAGPLRDISISGISDTKLASLHRQKSALAAKFVAVYDHSFWEGAGLNGVAYMEHNILGGVWAQSAGIMSGLVPPQRMGTYLATPRHHLGQALIDEVVDAFGDAAATPAKTYTRSWGTAPWTQGYVTAWRPGDARQERAAVLRVRVRPVAVRPHGRRRAHWPRRRPRNPHLPLTARRRRPHAPRQEPP
ncbi:flavin monoamine oxidase family protein [Streptomyces hygroscopicus]|uniref:flavin monoamine oxidase family protein n=1 Tax=Streptomyces hygroscopicus TaxID=1912 RepID=UPI003677D903